MKFWKRYKGERNALWEESTEKEIRKIMTGNWIDIDLAINTLKNIGFMHGSPFTYVSYGEKAPENN